MKELQSKNLADVWLKSREAEAAKMYIKSGDVVLNYAYPYHVPLSSCKTPGKILGWVNQLSGKTWMNTQRLNRFAQLAFRQIGIEVDYGI